MTNKEAIEYFLSSEEVENSLINQPFIKKISGEDDLDFDIDFDVTIDTDMDRNPYNLEQILFQINNPKKSTISSIENGSSKLSDSIREWGEKFGLDIYFDAIYTNDDNQVTIIFDIPADDSSWNYNDFMEVEDDNTKKDTSTKKNRDEIETIADQHWKDYKGKANYKDFLEIFKIGYISNQSNQSKKSNTPNKTDIKTSKAADGNEILEEIEEIEVNQMADEVNAELKKKYGVTTEDIGVTEEWWESAKDKNLSTKQMVSMLIKDYSLTPINPEKKQSNDQDEKIEKSHYICLIKDYKNNIIGKYELAYNDEDYAKMFLEVIGVRLRNGDKIEFE